MTNKKTKDSSLQGFIRLIKDATIGVTDSVEAMQKQILYPPFLPVTPIQHLITNIAGITYNNIRWGTKFIGDGLDKTLGYLAPMLGEMKSSEEKEAITSVLNGVIGDYLAAEENPLAISMKLKYDGAFLSLDQPLPKKVNGKILLMVHGLCMNDLQWTRKGQNHGVELAKALDKTPLYLRYNSGQHISTNGQELNELLEELVTNWPVPVEELLIVAHSMGGLVTRSAFYYGEKAAQTWTSYLKKIVFLGTPHHGAPLERAGNYLDLILETIPYTRPFARYGKIRSAGVTDLRYGNLLDEDWNDQDRFELQGDPRQAVPLPKKVDCYSIAAMIGKESEVLSHRLLGDSLVYIDSALGIHDDFAKHLNFKVENTWIAYEKNHLDLLNDAAVYTKIKTWLTE